MLQPSASLGSPVQLGRAIPPFLKNLEINPMKSKVQPALNFAKHDRVVAVAGFAMISCTYPPLVVYGDISVSLDLSGQFIDGLTRRSDPKGCDNSLELRRRCCAGSAAASSIATAR